MLSKFKRIIYTAAAALALSLPTLAPVAVYAENLDTAGGASCGIEAEVTSAGGTCPIVGADANLSALVKKIINVLSVIVGVIAVIMIIIGGLRYITSGGDSGNVSSAKNTIIYAIVGLIIVALAQFIVRFVLSNTAGI
jgi:Type IV secretion system pilin